MAKDFLGNELKEGDYFAYPLTRGRSAVMAIFRYSGEHSAGTHKAFPVERTWSDGEQKYQKWDWNSETQTGLWRPMTPEERAKVDAKTSTLRFLEEKAVKLKGYKPYA